jgi:hypothetical protein
VIRRCNWLYHEERKSDQDLSFTIDLKKKNLLWFVYTFGVTAMTNRIVVALVSLGTLSFGSGAAIAQPDPPSASVTIGGIGNPAQAGGAHTDSTWTNCTGATRVELLLYKVTINGMMRTETLTGGERSNTSPAATGTMGNDWGIPADNIATGDKIFVRITVYNGNNVIKSEKSADFTVP